MTALMLALCCLLILPQWLAAASLLDPRLRFKTLASEHFRIYFHQGEEAIAARLAAIAEDSWRRIGGAFAVTAPKLTHVIIADQSELANGWATPIPYNTIFVTAAAPSGVEFIGQNDDWLRLVFTHEFTHIVHLDRSEGWARFLRGVFGRTPIAFPNLTLPPWIIEGIAQWEESAITGSGRRSAGDFRAIEREAGRTRQVEPLDRLNGGLTDWPGGSGPYAFGLGFHEFLANRYGAERFSALARATAGTLPFAGATAFGDVFGASLGSLWTEYTRALETPLDRTPGSGQPPTRLTHHGFTVVGPRFLPPACPRCTEQLAYSTRDPHEFPALRETSLDGRVRRRLASRYLGSTVAGTERYLLFDQQEFRRDVGLYSDLYLLDRATGSVRALTREARLSEPDLSPQADAVVAVRQRGDRRELVALDWRGADAGPVRILLSEAGTSFDAPRWSPDGRRIAVSRHRTGAQAELVTLDATGDDVRVIAAAGDARVVTPAWRRDGRAIVAASNLDGDTFNLYEFAVDGSGTVRQLTHTTGGASWPDVSADGETLAFVGYTVNGFDVFTMPYPKDAPTMAAPAVRARLDSPLPDTLTRAARAYSPWTTLAPTTWSPLIENDNRLRAGVTLNGGDVLGRHAYAASATWLVDRPQAFRGPTAARPDWSAAYAYNRWRPSFFASASSETIFFSEPATELHPAQYATVREDQVEAGVFLRVRHARRSHRLLASLLATSDRRIDEAADSDQTRVSARFGVSTATAQQFGYSISPEHGATLGATAEVSRRSLGSSADATILTTDARGYLPGLARHHVVALRAAGGALTRDEGIGRGFFLGGPGPDADVLDFGRDAVSLLRGFPSSSFFGRRVAVVNADYRLAIARPQRGFGTWPFFLHTVHAALFADAGAVWNSRFNADDTRTSVGGELSFNVVLGHALPLTVTAGAAWGHDRHDGSSRTTVFTRIGRAF